jgi:hypothetical protein
MGPGEWGPKRNEVMGGGEPAPKRMGPGELIGGEWAPNDMSESLSEGVGLRGGCRGPPPWCASWAASCCCCILHKKTVYNSFHNHNDNNNINDNLPLGHT